MNEGASGGRSLSVWLIASSVAYKRLEVRRFIEFAAPRIARNLMNTNEGLLGHSQ